MSVEELKPKIQQDITMAQLLVFHKFRAYSKTWKKVCFVLSFLVLYNTKVLEFLYSQI
jgi:hypothetical protein